MTIFDKDPSVKLRELITKRKKIIKALAIDLFPDISVKSIDAIENVLYCSRLPSLEISHIRNWSLPWWKTMFHNHEAERAKVFAGEHDLLLIKLRQIIDYTSIKFWWTSPELSRIDHEISSIRSAMITEVKKDVAVHEKIVKAKNKKPKVALTPRTEEPTKTSESIQSSDALLFTPMQSDSFPRAESFVGGGGTFGGGGASGSWDTESQSAAPQPSNDSLGSFS